MPGLFKLLAAAALCLFLAAAPVAAQNINIDPIPPRVKPQWTRVPNVPRVFHAPNLPTDVFRHGSKYYFYWEGYLYRGSKARGPWKAVTKVPDWFPQIDPALFKTTKQGSAPPPAAPGTNEGASPLPPLPPIPEETEPSLPPPAPEKEKAPAPPAAPAKPPNVM
ncbi:MAG: hypothetical protein M1438_08575 [Deltaproteobacteria bacterium]|nr:hypothetical protein [Deltaproteobacteria bacterium]